jgi:hypothetical protein
MVVGIARGSRRMVSGTVGMLLEGRAKRGDETAIVTTRMDRSGINKNFIMNRTLVRSESEFCPSCR